MNSTNLNVRVSPAPAGNFDTGLVITTYNRPQYVWKTLRCLQKTLDDKQVVLVVVDDGSSSWLTPGLIRMFASGGLPVATILKQEHRGFCVHESLRMGWDYLLENHSPRYLCNLDSDVVMKPGWLKRVQDLYILQRARLGPLLVTGFNAPSHPVLEEHEDFLVKKSIGGLNFFFDAGFYHEIVRDNLFYDNQNRAGWDWNVINAMKEKGYPILSTKPSVLQHIGMIGKFSDKGKYDQALDF